MEGVTPLALAVRPRRTAAAVAGVLLAALPLGAQVRPDTVPVDSVVPIEAVVVSTTRTATTVGGASATLVVPDSLQLQPAATLEQALREIPFVLVRENSRGMAEISVRGSESRQVAVLVDGIPLTLGWDHRTDPSIIPITGVRTMAMVRGLSSILYGPNVLGGVVDIGIAQGSGRLDPPPGFQLRSGVDHLGGYALSVTGGTTAETTPSELSVRGGVGYRSRPGVAQAEGVEDPFLTGDGLRANSDAEQVDGFASLRYQSRGGGWLGFATSAYQAERGVPPELHVQEPRLWRYPQERRLFAVLSAGTGQRPTLLGVGDLEASVGVDVQSQEIESFETRAFDLVEGTESSEGGTFTLRVIGDQSLGAGNLAAALTYADVSHDEVADAAEFNSYRQRLWSLGSELAWPIVGDGYLSAGLVVDGADTPESGDKPPLGRLWAWGGRLGASTLLSGGKVRMHASLSSRARFPALRELYSGALGRFVPNPDLDPERLLGAEAGATLRHPRVELQGVVFHHRLTDAVVRTSAGGRKFIRVNRDEIRSTGLELLAGWRRGGVEILGDLMLQAVSVHDPGVIGSERQPEHMPEFRAGLDFSAPIAWQVTGFASAQYTGTQFCVHPDLETNVELGGELRADAGLERTWTLGRGGLLRRLRTTVALDNLADAAVYDQCGLPQPGRTLRFAVEIG